LTEVSGDVLDYSGKGNNGTINGSPTRDISGPVGYSAYNFDGSSDSISATPYSTSDFDKLTFSVWVRPTDNTTEQFIMAFASTTTPSHFEFHFEDYDSDGDFELSIYPRDDNQDGNIMYADNYFPDSNWSHIAGVKDGESFGDLSLYLNGVELSTSASGIGTTTTFTIDTFTIAGKDTGSLFSEYQGDMFDARVYDRALSQREISYLYEVGLSGNIRFDSKTSP
jgi:hypothetical protein